MRGAIPPLPQYAFMAWWCSVKSIRTPLPFNLRTRALVQRLLCCLPDVSTLKQFQLLDSVLWCLHVPRGLRLWTQWTAVLDVSWRYPISGSLSLFSPDVGTAFYSHLQV